jgi:hypothetical protein
MRESGDEYIFAFHRLLDRIGILAQGCVVAIDDATSEFNGKHVIATQNLDIALHDGARVQSLLETRVRKWLFDNINPEYVRLCRLAVRKSKKEVWFAFPYGSSTVLNMALVWHWQTGAFSLQQLPNVMDIAAADYLPGGGEAPDSWDGESALAWEDDDVIWSPPFAPTWRGNFVGDLFMASAVGKAILRVGDGYAPAQESYVERRGICHFPSENGPVAAPELVKLLTSVWPKARGSGVTLRIYVSLRMTPDAAVNWIGPLSFIVGGSAPCVDVYKAGRYIDVKVTDGGGAASEWALEGLALDVSPLGGF